MTPPDALLGHYHRLLERMPLIQWWGRVEHIVGQVVESDGPPCSVGELCVIGDETERALEAQVIGFRGHTVLSMPLRAPLGVRHGSRIVALGRKPDLRVGMGLVGRVIDACGAPCDGRGEILCERDWPFDRDPPPPLSRTRIRQPLGCGIRALDALLTCGRGQRLGIFGGSGVGKSTLIGMMTRNTAADLTVLALVGERGREVGEFLEVLGEEGRRRAVVVVSTSDQTPLLRIRAAQAATAIAEFFCERGKHVLLVVDSLTRYAMALRDLGLAAGEPPTAKGYTPSVFAQLARLLERAGSFAHGSITAFYSVLMEGDDQQDPMVDAARALLDGHIVLDRTLAVQGHFPAINVLDSLSRLQPAVTTDAQRTRAARVRELLATYHRSEDLVRVGAYQPGADPMLDQALASLPALQRFLRQPATETVTLSQAIQQLLGLELAA